MGLVPNLPGRVVGGEILFDGQDLLHKSPEEMCSVRGLRIRAFLLRSKILESYSQSKVDYSGKR